MVAIVFVVERDLMPEYKSRGCLGDEGGEVENEEQFEKE